MANGTDRKSSAKVYVKAPGASSYTSYSYSNAKNYVFNKEGKYSVYYVVTNKNKTSASTKSSVITVTVKAKNTSTEESTTTEQPGSSEESSTNENSSSETESSEVSSAQ
jgi:PKD repeat protein